MAWPTVELTYDGKTVLAIAKCFDVYTKFPLEGTFEEMIDMLRFAHGVEAPAADLPSAGAFEIMMANVTAARDLGSGAVGGGVCDHLAFRTRDTDWEIFSTIAVACITSHRLAAMSSYTSRRPCSMAPRRSGQRSRPQLRCHRRPEQS